ncbi:hypothetical protein AB0C59_22330 [Streptomyces sp. NPDC048664]|uniref:glycerophosphoryl diester phosphodiesterase membrane domain-containing protein n=1 Tax=Streptomyces sp. NPDC048664 TaxID=3154505 RepID=UPI003418F5F7
MEDTPGWASPGSAPSDGQQPGTSGSQPPEQPSDQRDADQAQPPQWSKEQPPSGQWTAPHPQGPGQSAPQPGPGWGPRPPMGPGGPGYGHGHGGWGTPGHGVPGAHWAGAWGPPPAAKPGIIPLRPLGLGEILDGAVSTMRAHWRPVLGISLAVAVVMEIVVLVAQKLFLDDRATSNTLNNPDASAHDLSRALGNTMLSSGTLMLILLLAAIATAGLLAPVTSRAVLGTAASANTRAGRLPRPQLVRLLGLTLLLPLIALAIMTAGIAPGVLVATTASVPAGVALSFLGGLGATAITVWIMNRYALAAPALMLERQSIRKSLSRSAKLVRGSWWRISSIQALAQVIAAIVSSLIVLPFIILAGTLDGGGFAGLVNGDNAGLGWTFLLVSGIGAVIGRMVTLPLTAGVTVLLYIDQRIRREALDLDLARAAGLPDPAATPSGATPRS